MEKYFLYIIRIFYKLSIINYLKKISYLLGKNLNQKFTLLDIGAANGVNGKWNIISDKLNTILVEPHSESAKNLKLQGLEVIESVLHSENDKKIKFYNTKKPMCSSFYKPNINHLKKFLDTDRFEIISEDIYNSKTLDSEMINFTQPNFIKIDTEGSELDILKGSRKTLLNVFGLEVECSFHQLREDQPLFEEIRSYLENLDFVFIDFVSMIRWEKDNFGFSGQPQITDALFLKNEETIIKKFHKNEISTDDLLNYFVILITYERVDILKYVYKKTDISLKYIEDIIKILEIKKNKINKLKQVQYSVENQILQNK
jgi:FkbM family methyltransferase|tara:strand:+ start:465 stop:1409 length:945 start_codon:yes stop_codon:yes gene_type:complete